ncbi:Pantothenate synthetase [Devosia sp. LC5]|uniref:pantoate--beta-alanine ligase n=1 Tax=Devosia sp. LC5 TaxID=1502724 RepID=UPI0004E3D675|nr:pantoate--beta-alanine ligase [Devosia sp. LC5]KFC64367.1 Pantothenate synthetase [Devosia sp. LC5]
MITILRTIAEVRAWRDSLPGTEKLGFVPTMGALHAGHISLMELARRHADRTIASIFVNPLQFGPNEDLSKYPRPIEQDLALLEAAGVDAVFLPPVHELYPPDASTFVTEDSVSSHLCGAVRPGHFRGVTTVVLKLFNIVAPDLAVFGQKDAQQCVVIERMVRDLNLRVQILRGPIVREADGLALSSRNIYLEPADRQAAPAIFRSLEAARKAFEGGERHAVTLAAIGRASLATEPRIAPQYWEVRHPQSLEPISTIGPEGALLAVAAHLGSTRLIDNLLLA